MKRVLWVLMWLLSAAVLPCGAGTEARESSPRDSVDAAPQVSRARAEKTRAKPKAAAASKLPRGAKAPKSYEAYVRRQTQGPRAFPKAMKERKYAEQGGRCTRSRQRVRLWADGRRPHRPLFQRRRNRLRQPANALHPLQPSQRREARVRRRCEKRQPPPLRLRRDLIYCS